MQYQEIPPPEPMSTTTSPSLISAKFTGAPPFTETKYHERGDCSVFGNS
jgi:hypothetical protein